MLQQLAVDEFLKRVADMPALEAVEEVEKRIDTNLLQLGLIQTRLQQLPQGKERVRLGREVSIICADGSRLVRAKKHLNQVIERTRWGRAVEAVFGREGWEQCREWMAKTEGELYGSRSKKA